MNGSQGSLFLGKVLEDIWQDGVRWKARVMTSWHYFIFNVFDKQINREGEVQRERDLSTGPLPK